MTEPLDTKYQLGDVLGRGGMGVVYSATQRSLQRRVAVKVPHPELAKDPFVVRRFRTEALAGAKLAHANIARVIDFGDDNGAPYLVMEHVAGTALEKLVAEKGPMSTRIASDVCMQILAALDAAHTAGIVHADIKTGNVLVERRPRGELYAHVIDFGLAHFTNEPSEHEMHMLSGTPDYLAPELIQGGTPTFASDIYAVGVVLYELVTGTTPFAGGSASEIMNRQIDDEVVPPSLRCPEAGIPEAIDRVVVRALAKDPSARYATANDFAEALRVAISSRGPMPQLVRGTSRPAAFSAEATTRDFPRELVAPRGPGSTASAEPCATVERTAVERCTAAVTEAVASFDPDTIVTAYLELARVLIDRRELAQAIAELERGLRLLRPSALATAASPIWRLQLCLAALYSGLGDATRARCAAIVGRDDAIRAESTLGQDRAGELLKRLSRGGHAAGAESPRSESPDDAEADEPVLARLARG